MTTTAQPPVDDTRRSTAIDDPPPAVRRPSPLARVNPLAKIAVTIPPMGFLLFTRDPWTPGLVVVVVMAVLIIAGHPRVRTMLLAVAGGALAVLWTAFVFSLVAGASAGAGTPVLLDWGPLTLRQGEAQFGAAAALRIAALLSLAWLGGAGTTGQALAGALVRQLRVPYRFAYGAVAVMRFVPRLRIEADTIHAAHRVRGVPAGRGPLGRVRDLARLLIPLLAGAIRYAERVSLAMDARGFGAHRTRRERHPVEFRIADALYLAAGLGGFAGLLRFSHAMGWLTVIGNYWMG